MTSLTQLTVGTPGQLSLTPVTKLVLKAGILPGQFTVTGPGHVSKGGVLSKTVIICVQVAELPHTSVALYVRVMVNRFAQLPATVTSPTCKTVSAPPQLSVSPVTRLIFAAGTSPGQLTVKGPGQVKDGGVMSLTVMI